LPRILSKEIRTLHQFKVFIFSATSKERLGFLSVQSRRHSRVQPPEITDGLLLIESQPISISAIEL
jgi:hypothetical protein